MATSIARVTEITAQSDKGFDDAIQKGIERACKTLDNVTGAWVQEMTVDVQDGHIAGYRVNMKVTFVLND
jgi:flavin-binding protein dodecin